VFLIFLGVALLGLHVYMGRYTPTPKNGLTMVTGGAANATISHIRGRLGVVTDVIRFTVQGQTVEYESTGTGYARLLLAVQRGEILTLGVSPGEESLIPRHGWVPLYTVSVGPEQVVRYEDAIAKRQWGSFAILGAAAVFLLMGASRVFR